MNGVSYSRTLHYYLNNLEYVSAITGVIYYQGRKRRKHLSLFTEGSRVFFALSQRGKEEDRVCANFSRVKKASYCVLVPFTDDNRQALSHVPCVLRRLRATLLLFRSDPPLYERKRYQVSYSEQLIGFFPSFSDAQRRKRKADGPRTFVCS